MNAFESRLFTIVGVMLPFVFIGPAYFLIPKFVEIFNDMLEGSSLPYSTEIVVSLPGFIWIVVASALAALNFYNSTKLRSRILACCSICVMFVLSGFIVISLFLPLCVTIKQMPVADASSVSNTESE